MEYPTEQKYPSIDLKIISCKDLRAFNFFQKLTIYAVVSIASQDPKRELNEEQKKQQQRTKTDRDSDDDGTNPEWNHDARFDLRWVKPSVLEGSDDLFLKFEFRHDGVLLGDKLIGECRVPIADLVRDDAAADVARFVSYEVRSGEGKPNGIFNFSYKLNGIGIGNGNWNNNNSSQILEGRISGYPVLDPEDCNPDHSLVQYPYRTEIESTCCYPTVASVQEGPLYSPCAVVAPPVPSFGECGYCYPPPSMPLPPPPPPYQYPHPPPPPYPAAVAQGVRYYPDFGPGAQSWPSGPSFEHRW